MIHQRFAGTFTKIEVRHKDGTSTVYDPFDNLITNSGLDGLGASLATTLTAVCAVSSNADAPLVTDTSVLNQVGSASSSASADYSNSGGTPDWFYQMERTYTFALGSVVGNISKLYIGSSGFSTLFSSALIKDGGGSPTTIAVTADDQLFITWRLRKYISVTPVTGNIDIGFDGVPTSVAYEIKPANLGQTASQYYFYAGNSAGNVSLFSYAFETQTLGSVTGKPSGTGSVTGATLSAYSNGNFYRDVTYTASLAQANLATGIGSLVYGMFGASDTFGGYQISFTPKLPKDSDKTLSLPFRISWGRA